MTNNWLPQEFQPYEHMTQSLDSFMNGDDVKIAKQDCIDNNNHGASTTEGCIEDSLKPFYFRNVYLCLSRPNNHFCDLFNILYSLV